MVIKGVRRVEIEDIPYIQSLINDVSEAYFGDVNISKLIEHSFLSICLYDEKQRIVAFMSLNNVPNVPAIPSWDWLPWIENLYMLKNLTSRNTLFINLMVWKLEYCNEFLSTFLKTVFYSYIHIQNIITVRPPGAPDAFFIDENFTRVLPQKHRNASKVQIIFITSRQRFVTRYKIRRAVEEDNDDIVPLIDEYSSNLRDFYGDFYVAEIIQSLENQKLRQIRDRHFIVAESNGIAVGVLCLTSIIDYDTLNQCFELRAYNGFKKPSSKDQSVEDVLNFETVDDKLLLKTSENNIESYIYLKSHSEESELTAEIQLIGEDRVISESAESIDNYTLVDSIPSYNIGIKSDPMLTTDEILPNKVHVAFSYILLSRRNSAESIGIRSIEGESYHQIATNSQLPQYYGEENAFAIELFATNIENERAITPDLIEACFECYPNREYCLLSIPSTYPPCPLLQRFVKVPTRPGMVYPHELYILHRSCLFGDINVREAREDDILSIKNLLHRTHHRIEDIILDITESIKSLNCQTKSYVLTAQNVVVGCICVREEHELDYIAAHYTVDDYIQMEHYPFGSFGAIIHGIISPIFQIHQRYFFREVHRLSDLPILYYCLYSDLSYTSLANVVSEMIPVQPSLRSEYHHNIDKDGDYPQDSILCETPPFALQVMNLRHCSIPKMDVNIKIVVVGGSDTGLAFLENLVYGQTASYITFTNITLVSTHGFNHYLPPNKARDLLFPFEGTFNCQRMLQICLHAYIHLVKGVMTTINRKEKYIIVDNGTILPYDYLYLTCGEQFQPPLNIIENNEYPKNLFVINTEIDGQNSLVLLKQLLEECIKEYTIIVYGVSIEAYCCLSALRQIGIPGKYITFVEPFPNSESEVSLFNDGEVDETVASAIEHENIKVYSSYTLKQWNYNKATKLLQSVTFESKFKLINIPCLAMFFYDQKVVSQANVSAITKAGGLVYDGRLVIDPKFRTNVQCIFAAGSITKYSRRYYADNLSQKYFNHYEVGERLALYAKKELDPTYIQSKDSKSESEINVSQTLTPLFSKPLITYCTLPGKLNYLYIKNPGKPVSLEIQMNKENYGRVLITGNANSKEGYFRLHLNENNFVETITCLTKNEIDVQNMIKLWGKHERLLNKLVQRFDMHLIPDLYEYFREPWACAIFHERFEEEIEKFNKLLLHGLKPGYSNTIIAKIIELFEKNEWQDLTPEQRNEIVELYENSTHKLKIEENLLQFLLTYDTHLPVYAHPLKAKLILQGYENSPLHFPQ